MGFLALNHMNNEIIKKWWPLLDGLKTNKEICLGAFLYDQTEKVHHSLATVEKSDITAKITDYILPIISDCPMFFIDNLNIIGNEKLNYNSIISIIHSHNYTYEKNNVVPLSYVFNESTPKENLVSILNNIITKTTEINPDEEFLELDYSDENVATVTNRIISICYNLVTTQYLFNDLCISAPSNIIQLLCKSYCFNSISDDKSINKLYIHGIRIIKDDTLTNSIFINNIHNVKIIPYNVIKTNSEYIFNYDISKANNQNNCVINFTR